MENTANLVENILQHPIRGRMFLEIDDQTLCFSEVLLYLLIFVLVCIVIERLGGKPRLVSKHILLQIFAKRLARGVLQYFDTDEIVVHQQTELNQLYLSVTHLSLVVVAENVKDDFLDAVRHPTCVNWHKENIFARR